MADENLEGIEIPDAVLNAIAGGVLDEGSKLELDMYLGAMKKQGWSQSQSVEYLTTVLGRLETPGLDLGEVQSYLTSAWDRV